MDDNDPMLTAAVDVVRRTGAIEVQIRYQDDEKPVVWMAAAKHNVDRKGIPVSAGDRRGRERWSVGAALNPAAAVISLAEKLLDGGVCTHCNRPSGIDPDREPGPMPLDSLICWYQYDQSTQKFVKGCTQ